MDRLQCRAQQQRGLIVVGRPSAFAVNALPGHIELRVDHDDGLGAPAAGAHDPVLVENLVQGKSSVHTPDVGSQGPSR